MARKKRRFNDGGEITDAPIEVKGKRNAVIIDPSQFDMSRIGSMNGPAAGLGSAAPMGGGGGSQRLGPIMAPGRSTPSRGMSVAPAMVKSQTSDLGRIAGASAKPGMGVRGRMKFAKGGAVGSASKRADGIAKKGKTKGKMR